MGNSARAWTFLTLCGVLLSCDPEPSRFRAESPLRPTRGYLLISIDTLRADHLGCYGYERDTSPFLDSLASRGTVFENAWVQLPGTLPSHMSIFTGLYPAEHGVYPPDRVLSSSISTIPEMFKGAGFSTGGFTEGGYTSGSYGFARGFDRFEDDSPRHPRGAELIFDRGMEFLGSLSRDESFFLFLHTYSVHDPYDAPEPFREAFWPDDAPEIFEPIGSNLVQVNRASRQVSDEQVAYLEALYDGGILYLDGVLDAFFERLEAEGLLDETTVIITSDHGEEFLEHGRLVHEQIYPETLHVPLIVLHPDLEGGQRTSALVQSIDIAPSLYSLARIPQPERISGKSFGPLLKDPNSRFRDEVYAEMADGSARSLVRLAEGTLFQHLRIQPRLQGKGLWVSDQISFDYTKDSLRFDVISYHEPRQVDVLIDGEPWTEMKIGTQWQSIDLALPEATTKRIIQLVSSTCDSPADLGESEDARCLAFRLKGISPGRTELYDLGRDPDAKVDRSADLVDFNRTLSGRLSEYEWQPVEEPGTHSLDSDLDERLRALGYLQ